MSAPDAAQPMLARKSVLIFANTVLGSALGILATKIVSLYLGPGPVGQLAGALGLVGILYFFTDLGFGTAHVKRVSEGYDEADCFATFAVFKIVATSAFLAAVGALIFVWTVVLHKRFTDFSLPTIALATVYYTLMSLRAAPQSTFDARRETARGQATLLTDTLTRVLVTVAVALVFAAVVRDAGPLAGRVSLSLPIVAFVAANPGPALAIASMLGAGVGGAVAFAYFLRDGKVGRFRPEILRSYWTFALPTFLIGSFATIAARIDVVALDYFGSSVDAGLFYYPRALTAVIEGIPIAVVTLLFPTLSRLAATGDHAELAALTNRAMRWLSLIVAPIVVFTIVFSRAIIHLVLADAWLPAATALAVLAAYTYLVSLTRPYGALLAGTDRPASAARIALVVYIVNIVLNVLLIPKDIKSIGLKLGGLGVTGAALASALSALVGYVLYRRAARRAIGMHETNAILKHLVAAAAMALALLALDRLVAGLAHWYTLVAFGAIGGAIYLAALVALREFTASDVRLLNDALHPFEALRYVREELFGRGPR